MRTRRSEEVGTSRAHRDRFPRREKRGHALLGLGEWPGVTAGWEVAAAEVGSVLRVELDFDPSSYHPRPSRRGGARWKSNAAHDLGVVRRLGQQLGAAEVRCSVESGLLPGGAAEVNGGAVLDWVGAIEAFLRDRAIGRGTPPPPAPLRLEWALDPAGVDPAPLFELTVDLVMQPARRPAPAPATLPGTPERVAARIPPSLRAKAGDGAAALERFAREFEAALRTASTQWKLASPTPADGNVDPSAPVSLWVLRVGSAPGDVRVSVPNPGAPRLYVPRLVADALVSSTGVRIRDYGRPRGLSRGRSESSTSSWWTWTPGCGALWSGWMRWPPRPLRRGFASCSGMTDVTTWPSCSC